METNPPAPRPGLTPLASLRTLVRPRARPARERCALCDLELGERHAHLVESSTHKLLCACDACALLFSGRGDARFRRVPRDVRTLTDFRVSDATWQALHLPINLVFFLHSTPAARVVALYPSPAGVTESPVDAEAWQTLVDENPVLHALEPDVEALLVNRIRDAREYFRAGIDECYRLAGLVRIHWRGLSGGSEVWGEINRFFAELSERAVS